MRLAARRGVDPIIATLLLIAIAVAAGILVYVYVNSISGGLTQGGGSQVGEGLSLDSYAFSTLTAPALSVRDTGGSSISINQVFFDGLQCQAAGLTCTAVVAAEPASNGCTGTSFPIPCSTGNYVTLTLTVPAQASGTSHLVRVVTVDGGTFTFSVVAGRSG